jgi:nitrate reductase gamma subunit
VFLATTRTDKLMYVVLAASILSGAWATASTQLAGGLDGGYDYRETISPWFRSLWYLQPQPLLMQGVPLSFEVHVVAAMLLFAIWPFTRLVHAFSAPVAYPFRPYVVYRTRDEGLGSQAPRRGWERTP